MAEVKTADELAGTARLEGAQLQTPQGPRKDEDWKKITRLIKGRLERLGAADGGWSVLYRDPSDGRLWEYTHPQGHLHGGGPPRLHALPEKEAREKYGGEALRAAGG